MKKVAVFILGIGLLSFKTSYLPQQIHVPEFLIIPSDWVLPHGATVECEAYQQGRFVDTLTDYLNGIDSVAIKYIDHSSKSKEKATYTNFYRRVKDQYWKKYNHDKILVQFVNEKRSDTVLNDGYYHRIYYTVR